MITVLERLASPLNVDSFLSTFNPLWGGRLQGVIESIVAVTSDSASVRIRPGRSWHGHVAGQFVTVGVDIAGVRHHRCFSLTSVPGAPGGLIEITVHCAGNGFVSRHLVHDARPGDVVQLTQAEGEFTLRSASQNSATGDRRSALGWLALPKLLFITGGSGVTPAMGMIRTVAATTDQTPDVVLLHHAPTSGQMMFHSELEDLAGRSDWLDFKPTFTASGGRHLDVERLELECPDWAEREVFVCGPAPLLDFVQDHWDSVGLGERVHVERFVIGLAGLPASKRATVANGSGADQGEADAAGARTDGITTFGRSGVEVPSEPGRPLLEVAESSGLAPAYGCRMGICHTCTTRLDEGSVTDLRDGRISEAGSQVQICVSAAVDDVSLEL
ncbi:MAG: ferredoxin reductase [Microthrixaceae bacterium]